MILGLYKVNLLGLNFGDNQHALRETFILFALILTLHVFVNIGGSHLVARFNGISVWWHVLGVAVIVVVLIFAPRLARELLRRVHQRGQQLRLQRRRVSGACSGSTCCRWASC